MNQLKKIIVDVNLKLVTKSDFLFLFKLLKERNPSENISHKKMPTYKKHVKFISSKPYKKWYIIKYQNKKVGSIYLTDRNEIGIFIKKEFQVKNIGTKAIKSLMKKDSRIRYLANINPKNIKSIKFFKKNGFKLIQHTYELEIN